MTQVAKVFHLKGKTRKTVKAIAFTRPDGSVGYTDNRKIADEFNARFVRKEQLPALPDLIVIPAREFFDGVA